MKDAIIVLSHKCESRGLSKEYKARLKKGIDLIERQESDRVIVCGKNSIDLAKGYLVEGGIKKENILTQIKARDTIGEAFFTKKEILVPRGWRNIGVVSSHYHIEHRAASIFDFILGPKFDIEYFMVKSGEAKRKKVVEEQIKSLNEFLSLFKGVSPGEDKEIEKRLFEKHKLYSQTYFDSP